MTLGTSSTSSWVERGEVREVADPIGNGEVNKTTWKIFYKIVISFILNKVISETEKAKNKMILG